MIKNITDDFANKSGDFTEAYMKRTMTNFASHKD
jgi:hypothetical protein